MIQDYNAYIFDVDGTILDTQYRILECLEQSLSDCDIAFDKTKITSKLIGPKISEIMDILGLDVTKEKKQEVIRCFRSLYDATPEINSNMFSNMADLLSSLQKSGKPLFIATNKPSNPLKKLMTAFSLDYFTDVYTPDKYEGKILSKTDMIAEILKKYYLSAPRTLYIGDTKGDLDASKANHCAFAFASWGYANQKENIIALSDEVLI